MKSTCRVGVVCAVLTAVAVWGPPAAAFEPRAVERAVVAGFERQGLSAQDRRYLEQAHRANLAEIAAGRLAQQKGSSPEVKQLGERLAADHAAFDDKLKPVAQQMGVRLPDDPALDQRAIAALLNAVPAGVEFDRMWVGSQLAAHEESMETGKLEVAHGTEAVIKQLAVDAEPVLAAHHDALLAVAPDFGITYQR